jgi:hypothetical protein
LFYGGAGHHEKLAYIVWKFCVRPSVAIHIAEFDAQKLTVNASDLWAHDDLETLIQKRNCPALCEKTYVNRGKRRENARVAMVELTTPKKEICLRAIVFASTYTRPVETV